MRVAIFGLGYVGCTSAACFAHAGHHVVGVDVNPLKVELVGRGDSPIVERGIPERLATAVAAGRLSTTTDVAAAVAGSEVSLVCVGTPSRANGSLDLAHLEHAVMTIGEALRSTDRRHVVAVRSTVLPGTVQEVFLPLLEETSRKLAGRDFGLCVNPEFLREGEAIRDFEDPPYTLIGELDEASGAAIAGLYEHLSAPVHRVAIRVAEGVKYASNCFHALKICFANELGTFLNSRGVDPFEVLAIFKQDDRLNISDAYLRPGYAFGGSCLPKDLRALLYAAKLEDLTLPLMESILPSNEVHHRRGLAMILATGRKRIGILGFSFKAGTDDLRESPMVGLIEALLGKGCSLMIYDRHVHTARLVGANREYIEKTIPHVSSLMRESMDDVLAHAEVVVVGNRDPTFAAVPDRLRPDQQLIDLVRLRPDGAGPQGRGICW